MKTVADPFDGHPLVVDVDPDNDPGSDIEIMVGGAAVGCVYGTDQFPCLDHDDDAATAKHDADVEAMAREIVRRCNAWPELVAFVRTCATDRAGRCSGGLTADAQALLAKLGV